VGQALHGSSNLNGDTMIVRGSRVYAIANRRSGLVMTYQ